MKFILLFLVFTSFAIQAKEINFNRDIRPILSDRCFHCHGPDRHDRKKKLRLDIAEGDDGAYRQRKGRLELFQAVLKRVLFGSVFTDDEDDVMPPLDSHKKALSKEDKELIKQWILQGAKYEKFWAFELPKIKEPTNLNLIGVIHL